MEVIAFTSTIITLIWLIQAPAPFRLLVALGICVLDAIGLMAKLIVP